MPKAIEFYKLTEQFYIDNKDNTQILFNKGGRGYGVILVKILGCDFAIPLHSNIKKGFILGINQETGIKHGLDYLKAIREQNQNILRTNYRNTTLVYYHHLLGITTK
ncbi:hypothetical protein [Actinobacillus pleuropneumoniae]|uniref:Uncharacterized protein n=1 Tax=Actinobacillus pleuropneumoniae TaxID=715 RepID=A0ABN5MIZ6_ACTPL|nr:hypothetical protein [Actinobacillus pleuropneumoniae]ASU16284.1 hypothetical protein CHY23_01538 [Actinobacillus pleuropneumoniae]AWG94758.1 hypothetical protein APPSER1_01835 [Actinobacillus pleuropneumoniae serovar 1 str. 4074]AXA20831.1 hypothetical protein DRF63_01835 [Actinobacillus pleuropneumoniae]EFM99224.1 hypothetical protein appser11_3780 [Actinobacillus pleuropneumoniae serovar 11 str. 56153]MBL4536740.1 hypothetical protein [Actinobacillus pleuropneumoniae]